MLLIISTLSFLYTILSFNYYTFIHISFSHCYNFVIHITNRLFESWHKGAALLLIHLSLPAPVEAENLSTTRFSIMISARHLVITIIITMTIQNLMTSLLGHHPGKQLASGYQEISSHQHLDNKWGQLNSLLCRCNPYILSVGRSVLSQGRRINTSLRCWYPGRYLIQCLNEWICPLKYIFTRGRIQNKPVSNWLHGKLEICEDMSPLLTTWQA